MATTSPRRRTLGSLLSVLLALLVVGGTGTAAHAAGDGYRYWNYFHVKNGQFAFATTGNAGFVPADGSIEAYRYGTSTAKQGLMPRADLTALTFDKVCAGTHPQAGKKRVAVLLDYGTQADSGGATPPAPRAGCAVVPTKANGLQVLDAVAKVRLSKGMTCGVDGYPAAGCGSPVKNATVPSHEANVSFTLPQQHAGSGSQAPATKNVAATPDDGTSGSNTALLAAGAVLVVLLLAGGLLLARRRQSA